MFSVFPIYLKWFCKVHSFPQPFAEILVLDSKGFKRRFNFGVRAGHGRNQKLLYSSLCPYLIRAFVLGIKGSSVSARQVPNSCPNVLTLLAQARIFQPIISVMSTAVGQRFAVEPGATPQRRLKLSRGPTSPDVQGLKPSHL